ncbi:MAG: SDR family NAD(P)-dependent oxidoreductase [Acholeplasmataceae bacterium]|nr:SDR family NAD(P)-dependent oxidoreductase [Acholeplasmataceae bacterium]
MNKIAIVTGATSGIGKAVVELLLKANVNVVALGRNQYRIDQVNKEFEPLTKNANLDFVLGDLSDNTQTKLAALSLIEKVNQKYDGKVDILMNIAGIVSTGYHENNDGNEMTFAVNHLAVFNLTSYIYPLLKKVENSRILVVSSYSHYWASMNWRNIQSRKMYNVLKGYKRSKLYNVFFVKEFARKHQDVKIYAIDPGLVNTEIGAKKTSGLVNWFWNKRRSKGTDAYYPAKYMVDIALKDEYLDKSGHYIKEGKSIAPSKKSQNLLNAKKLWEYSEDLLNIKFK